ncbi:ribonuclease T [Buchnera aphidicola str. Bp (Baizongia pistaciae)]|uniref:Ribonuclease T n=1 Tax=Buchnera aphidicola subsp. Baizongia pistaciae (strain Bp) TaxID=224915 RepID=RNT_BUCBP|nr:ribonuclease T [Buchnera aphidicola]P59497.1 RecName: Full=Ribonuclease T; AltName: Full=Exoribonuclease T; Short=RNase T [Buchnera aphidicola str. Bp (Baizongia pistaciae)]AAO26909.1 ribonuclease T [Buchnera aphidicola str. Bp (Baizongia pistaciae)]
MCYSKINNSLRKRFRTFYPVVIDIETAGFNPETDAILEIAIITLKMNEFGLLEKEHLLHFHIQPFKGSRIDKKAIEFHGIDPFSPLRRAISEYEALYSIFNLIHKGIKSNNCTKSIIVAHNAIFDYNFLTAAITRTKIKNNPFHSFVIFDTATLSGLAVGQTVLARACKAIGLTFDNNQAHSALYDTQQTANLFCKIVNRWKTLGGWPPNDTRTIKL